MDLEENCGPLFFLTKKKLIHPQEENIPTYTQHTWNDIYLF